jgi:hypothetical protein
MSFQDAIAEAAKKAQQDKAEVDAERVRSIHIDILTKGFDRASAYTNLVMFGGYAGAFTIWNFTRDMLGTLAQASVALLLIISLVTFIFFEVFKMVINAKAVFRQRAILTKGMPPEQFFTELRQLEQQENLRIAKIIMPIWRVAMVITVFTALGAFGILLWVFAANVITGLTG